MMDLIQRDPIGKSNASFPPGYWQWFTLGMIILITGTTALAGMIDLTRLERAVLTFALGLGFGLLLRKFILPMLRRKAATVESADQLNLR